MLSNFQPEPRMPSIMGSIQQDSREGFTEAKEGFGLGFFF